VKDAQASGEGFIPQKRISRASKHEISSFLFLWVIFALLDPADLNQFGSMRIRIKIKNTAIFLKLGPPSSAHP
jgi:hypothetical protein